MLPVSIHVLCILCVVLDQLVRAWRIARLVDAVGGRLGLFRALALNVYRDVACALTPMRIGGEPVRLMAMRRAGIRAELGLAAVGVEALVAWPAAILTGALLAWLWAPAWWAESAPRLARTSAAGWPWLALVVVASVLCIAIARRARPQALGRAARAGASVLEHARGVPCGTLLAAFAASLASLAARVAVLPLLVAAVPASSSAGPVAFVSFALLHGQLVLPTPSGAGAIELGFLGGVTGDLAGAEAEVLLQWRLYTSGVSLALLIVLVGLRGRRLVGVARDRLGRRTAARARRSRDA